MNAYTHEVERCSADEEARADARFAAWVKAHEGETHHAWEWREISKAELREQRCERVLRSNGTYLKGVSV